MFIEMSAMSVPNTIVSHFVYNVDLTPHASLDPSRFSFVRG